MLKYLPLKWRLWWDRNLCKFSNHVQANWHKNSCILDCTEQKVKYMTDLFGEKLGPISTALDKTPIPNVICPLGCHTYFHECKEITFFTLLKKMIASGGEGTLFPAARSNWPLRGKILNFEVNSAVVLSNSIPKLLCCARHRPKIFKKEMIHTGYDPVSPLVELSPDTFAPAVVVPNVIRAPRLGKWNVSSHVVIAIGGYRGLSTFSLAGNWQLDIDEIANRDLYRQKTKFMLESRPEVLGYEERKRASLGVKHRDTMKYGPTTTSEAINKSRRGASFVTQRDAYELWRALGDLGSEKMTSEQKIPVIHPVPKMEEGSGIGHGPLKPVKIRVNNKEKHVNVVSCILQHSPVVANKLKAYCNENDGCEGFKKNTLQALNEMHASEGGSNIPVRAKSDLWKFLCKYDFKDSASWSKLGFSENTFKQGELNGEELASDESYMIYQQLNSDVPITDVPEQKGDYFLQALYSSNAFKFRWEEQFDFQVCDLFSRQPTSPLTHWMYAVYQKRNIVDNSYSDLLCGLQKKCQYVLCATHKEKLNWVARDDALICGQEVCSKLVRLRCLAKNCLVGTCMMHAKILESGKKAIEIKNDMALPSNWRANQNEEENGSQSENEDLTLNWGDEWLRNYCLGSNDGEGVLQFSNCMYSRSDTSILQDAAYRSIPGHFLLNNGLGVLRRNKIAAKTCLNSVISHMASVISANPVPLLFPESLLFPRLFADSIKTSDSIIGCLPSFMFMEGGHNYIAPNLATLEEHMQVRASDMFLNCARTPSYQHFIFDIQANRALKHSCTSSIMKRGLSFIPELRMQRHLPSSKVTYDEVTAETRLKEVAHMVKNSPWNFFMTLTCNDNATPGVAAIYKSINKCFPEEKEKRVHLGLSLLPIAVSYTHLTLPTTPYV